MMVGCLQPQVCYQDIEESIAKLLGGVLNMKTKRVCACI